MLLLTVFSQILIITVLIAAGAVCTKAGLIDEKGSRTLTDLLLILVTPCAILKSFFRPFSSDTLRLLLLALLLSAAFHALCIGFAEALFRDRDRARSSILRFATVFSNCGYMALPLQQAVLGDDGVLFASAFIAVTNLFSWSYGIKIMGGNDISVRKMIVNPGTVGLGLGLLVFLLPITLPDIFVQSVGHLAALNTPIPMLIVGYSLTKTPLLRYLRDSELLLAIFLRLIVTPLVGFGLLWLIGIRGTLLISMMISFCAPVAAATLTFSIKFGGDERLAGAIVPISTLLSLITMPLLVTLAKWCA